MAVLECVFVCGWKSGTPTAAAMRTCNPLRRSCVSCERNAGESAIWPVPARPSAEIARVECAKCRRECDIGAVRAQPSAEIMRVECAKCRRECDLARSRATLCGDHACRVREMQARVRLARSARNPLRRSCASSERNAGESAIGAVRAQPSAEIVRVECAKCRRECDWRGPRATLCGDRACRVRRIAGESAISHVYTRATLCGDRACRVREMQARVRLARSARNPLRRSCASSARNTGESAIGSARGQPSAEIVRVECAKCRRECDASCTRATLCGDRARRAREMQARVRWVLRVGNPLRRSCVSSARNAGESAMCHVRGQPPAEIVRVECAKGRRECDVSHVRATLCGDRACRVREMQARVRFVLRAGNPLRRSCVSSTRNAGESAICRVHTRNPLRRSCVWSTRKADESAIWAVLG